MEAAAPDGKERCLGSGETEPIAVGKDDVAGLPHQLHLLERRVPQALMGDPERIDPNDPCRLASRLSRGEGRGHPEVGAVDRVAERVEGRGLTLERANRILAGSTARERRAEQTGAYEARGPPGYTHHGSDGKDQNGQPILTGLPLESRPVPRAAIRVDNRPACPSRFGETACWRHRPPRTPARAPCRDPRASGAARCPCRSAAGRCRSLRAPASA